MLYDLKVSGNLPTTKFEINMQKWYRVIYIPDIQDIIILSNRDIYERSNNY